MALFTGHITVYAGDWSELHNKVRLLEKLFADNKCETTRGAERYADIGGVTFRAQTLHLPTVTDMQWSKGSES